MLFSFAVLHGVLSSAAAASTVPEMIDELQPCYSGNHPAPYDVPYDTAEERAAMNDTYYKEQRQFRFYQSNAASVHPGTPLPLIVYIHGGGWSSGDRQTKGDEMLSIFDYRDYGYHVASMGYRLAMTSKPVPVDRQNPRPWERAVWPAQEVDLIAGMTYLRKNASTLGVDTNRFVLLGQSAGGHLAQIMAFKHNSGDTASAGLLEFYGVYTLQRDGTRFVNQSNQSSGDAISNLLGCYPSDNGCPALAADASPIAFINEVLPSYPIFILQGTNDTTTPQMMSDAMYSNFTAMVPPRDATYMLTEGAGHAMNEVLNPFRNFTIQPQSLGADVGLPDHLIDAPKQRHQIILWLYKHQLILGCSGNLTAATPPPTTTGPTTTTAPP